MWTEIVINGTSHIVSLADDEAVGNPIRSLASGRAFELTDANGLSGAVDLKSVAYEIRSLMKSVAAQFVGRDELIQAFVTAGIAGEHTFVYGPPGTAKTAVAGGVVEAIGGRLWRTLLNADITRDDIYGAIDPQSLKAGKW